MSSYLTPVLEAKASLEVEKSKSNIWSAYIDLKHPNQNIEEYWHYSAIAIYGPTKEIVESRRDALIIAISIMIVNGGMK